MSEFRRTIRRWLADGLAIPGGGGRGESAQGVPGEPSPSTVPSGRVDSGGVDTVAPPKRSPQGGQPANAGGQTLGPASPGPNAKPPQAGGTATGATGTSVNSGHASWGGAPYSIVGEPTLVTADGSIAQQRREVFAPPFGGEGVHPRWDEGGTCTLVDAGAGISIAATTGFIGRAIADHTADWVTQQVSVLVSSPNTGLAVRMSDLSGYVLLYQVGPQVQLIRRFQAGTTTVKATWALGFGALNIGLKAENEGGDVRLTGYQNGVEIGNVLDVGPFQRLDGACGIAVSGAGGLLRSFQALRLD